MHTVRALITIESVKAFNCPEGNEARLWDTEITGFMVRARPTGRKVYAVRYKIGGVSKIYTIGTHGAGWTPKSARDKAKAVLQEVGNGIDPTADKIAQRHALTVCDLIERYLSDGRQTKLNKRESSWSQDASNLRRHILPLLGKKIAGKVTFAEANKAIKSIINGDTAITVKTVNKRGLAVVTGGLGTARRVKSTAAAMYNWAKRKDINLVSENPFEGIQLSTTDTKERFLSQKEAADILEALESLERGQEVAKAFGDAIRLLMLTGARKVEITALKWTEIDFDAKCIILSAQRTKTGNKTGERRITLMPAALAILAERQKDKCDSEYVFPSPRSASGPVVGLRRIFVKVCSKAGIDGVRIHDLRHSFASFAVANGASLFLVSKLLGHATSRTTERYAHLNDDPLQEAVINIERRLLSMSPTNEQKEINKLIVK